MGKQSLDLHLHFDRALPDGDPLYARKRTGPAVPAHSGNDQEHDQLSGNYGSRTLSRAARS